MAAAAMTIDQDQPVLAAQTKELEASLRSVIVAIARLARFQVDVHRLGVQGFVPKAPTAYANALRGACSDYQKSLDSIETYIRHAIAVIERDIRVATGQPHPSLPAAAPAASPETSTVKEDVVSFTTDVVDLSTPTAIDSSASKNAGAPEVIEIDDDDDAASAKVSAPDAGPASAATGGPAGPPEPMSMDDDIFGGSLFGSNANSEAEPSAPVSPAGAPPAPAEASTEGTFEPQIDLLNQLVAATSGPSSSAQPPAGSSSAIDLSSLLTGVPPSSSSSTAPPAAASRPPTNGAPSADLLALFESLQSPAALLGTSSAPLPSASVPSVGLSSGAALFESALPSTLLGPFPGSSQPGGGSALNLNALASSSTGDLPPMPTLATSGPSADAGAAANEFNVGDMLMDQSEFESLLNSYTADGA